MSKWFINLASQPMDKIKRKFIIDAPAFSGKTRSIMNLYKHFAKKEKLIGAG